MDIKIKSKELDPEFAKEWTNKPHRGYLPKPTYFNGSNASGFESMVIQMLEGHLLPLLPKSLLFIYNMHITTKVSPECYAELKLLCKKNNGQYHTDIINDTRIDYVFYSKGTIKVNLCPIIKRTLVSHQGLE